MKDEHRIDAMTIQLLYSLWDASLPGRERVLAWEPPPQNENPFLGGRPRHSATPPVLKSHRPLGRESIFPEGFVEEFFGKEVLRCHAHLEQLLKSMRTQRGDPSYLEFIDKLVHRCKDRWPDYTPKYYPKVSGNPGFHP